MPPSAHDCARAARESLGYRGAGPHARLNLRRVGEPVFAGDIRVREHLLSASITVANADQIRQLYVEFQSAGVRFDQKLETEPWGAQTFIVADPDGNLILFAGPAA